MTKEIFKIEIRLKNLSIISFATYLWKFPDVKKKISDFFRVDENQENNNKKWDEVTAFVFEKLKLIPHLYLPAHLLNELNDAVIHIGEKIHNWMLFVTDDLKLNFEEGYTEEFYINQYGVIDEGKIFDLYWEKDPKYSNMEEETYYSLNAFMLSSMYAREDFIDKNKENINKFSSLFYLKRKPKDAQDLKDLIMAAGLYRYICSQRFYVLPQIYRSMLQKFRSRGLTIELKNMFFLSAAVGLSEAVKYYYYQLDVITREKELPAAAELCLKQVTKLQKYKFYLREKYLESLVFLLNRLTEKERNEFIAKNAGEMVTLFLKWPFQNLYVLILETALRLMTNYECTLLMKRITDFISEDCRSRCGVQRNMYKILLQMTWCRLNDSQKAHFYKHGTIISRLFTYSQYSVLRTFINLKNLPEGVEFKDLDFPWRLSTVIKNGKLDVLNKFVKEIFNSDEDLELFKIQMVDYAFNYIMEGRKLKQGEAFLDWCAGKNGNREYYKNQINNKNVVCHLISKRKSHLLNMFLGWRFNNDKVKIENFKYDLKNDEVTLKKIEDALKRRRFFGDDYTPFDFLGWLGNPEKTDLVQENIPDINSNVKY